MSQNQYREPPIDKASSRKIIDIEAGDANGYVKNGNAILGSGRIIGGNYNRVAMLLGLAESFGLPTQRINNLRTTVMIASMGFSPELHPRGMRGELEDIITLQQLPKKETVTNTSSGIIRRGAQPQQPQPTTEAQQE